jgi:prophage regulatory protein
MSIMRMPAVKVARGFKSHVSIYYEVNDGLFTEPVLIGERSVGWPEEEVRLINAARIAGQPKADIRSLVIRLHAKRQKDFEALTSDTFFSPNRGEISGSSSPALPLSAIDSDEKHATQRRLGQGGVK